MREHRDAVEGVWGRKGGAGQVHRGAISRGEAAHQGGVEEEEVVERGVVGAGGVE